MENGKCMRLSARRGESVGTWGGGKRATIYSLLETVWRGDS